MLFAEFASITGLKVIDCERSGDRGTFDWCGEKVEYSRGKIVYTEPITAKVLASDAQGNPLISENRLGKGRVIYVNFPIETAILKDNKAFETKNFYLVYKKLFEDKVNTHEVVAGNRFVGVTLHPDENGEIYCVAVNYSHSAQKPELEIKDGYVVSEVYYGNLDEIGGFDGVVFKVVKK